MVRVDQMILSETTNVVGPVADALAASCFFECHQVLVELRLTLKRSWFESKLLFNRLGAKPLSYLYLTFMYRGSHLAYLSSNFVRLSRNVTIKPNAHVLQLLARSSLRMTESSIHREPEHRCTIVECLGYLRTFTVRYDQFDFWKSKQLFLGYR